MAVGAYVTIPPPQRTRRAFGLFTAATVVDIDDPHELMGVQWDPPTCTRPQLWRDDCPPVDQEPKAAPPDTATRKITPITAYGAWQCQHLGVSLTEAVASAREHLTAGEERAVEYGVWTGAADNNPHLADPATINLGEATCAPELFSKLLEHVDIAMVGTPVFHVPSAALPWINGHIRRTDAGLTTKYDIPIAAGTGYTEANTGPGGQPAPDGAWWIYTTGPVHIRRGPITNLADPPQHGFNPRTNELLTLAERRYLVGWDCTTAAVLYNPTC